MDVVIKVVITLLNTIIVCGGDMNIIKEQIQDEIDLAMSKIKVQLRWDSTTDLEVSLFYNDKEISSDYIDLDELYTRKEI